MKDKTQDMLFNGILFFLYCYFIRIFNFPNELIVVLGAILCLLIVVQQKKIKIDIGICLLTSTMLSYYLIVYGLRGLTFSIVYIPMVIYILAKYMTVYVQGSNKKYIALLFSMIIGYSLHGILNSVMFYAGFRVPGERRWLDVWTQEWMLGTHHAVFFLPVMALFIPAILFFKKRKWANGIAIIVSVFFLYTSLATRSRTPVLAFAIVVFVQLLLYVILEWKTIQNKISDRRIWIMAGVMCTGAVIALYFIKDMEVVETFIKGLSKGGGIINNVRFVAQRKALEQLFVYPMGGYQMDLGRSLCHNTWLDMANAAGLIPFFLFVAYTIFSLFNLTCYVFKKEISLEKKLVMSGIYTAFFMFFTVEPALEASIHYITPWVFANAMVHEELCDMKKKKGE